MSVYSFLLEISGFESGTANHSAHAYSHLMKCVSNNEINTSWIGTILNANKYLYSRAPLNSIRKVMSDKKALDNIKYDAIDEYHKEGNKDGERMFEIVLKDFPTIMDLRDPIKVTNYLIALSKQTGDEIMVANKCKKHLSELKL